MKANFFIAFILIQTISFSFQSCPTIKTGKYFIFNKDNYVVFDIEKQSTKCGANLIIADKTGVLSQQFIISQYYGEYYTITNVKSKLALTAEFKKEGSKIEQTEIKGCPTIYQLWKFSEVCDDLYLIFNKASGLAINGDSCARNQCGDTLAILVEKPCTPDIDNLLFKIFEVCPEVGCAAAY